MEEPSFLDYYQGTLSGILNAAEYDALIETIEGELYAIDFSSAELGVVSMSEAEVKEKLLELRQITASSPFGAKIRYPYTYVKGKQQSRFIKTYNPASCGGSCSTKAPDPWWVFSAVKPAHSELQQLRPPANSGLFTKLKSVFDGI